MVMLRGVISVPALQRALGLSRMAAYHLLRYLAILPEGVQCRKFGTMWLCYTEQGLRNLLDVLRRGVRAPGCRSACCTVPLLDALSKEALAALRVALGRNVRASGADAAAVAALLQEAGFKVVRLRYYEVVICTSRQPVFSALVSGS